MPAIKTHQTATSNKTGDRSAPKTAEPEIERRNVDLTEFRLIDEEGQKPRIVGHAAVFNKLSEPMWGFREQIAPEAFKKSLGRDDIRALFNHDANYVLGRNKAKTLTLNEDDQGLAIEIDPPDTQWARDLQESIRRGDISQMSFGFIAVKDEWLHEKGKESIRTLLEVKLFDVSPVTFPAYPQTSVKVRDYLDGLRNAESEPDDPGPPEEGADESLETYKRRIAVAELNQ